MPSSESGVSHPGVILLSWVVLKRVGRLGEGSDCCTVSLRYHEALLSAIHELCPGTEPTGTLQFSRIKYRMAELDSADHGRFYAGGKAKNFVQMSRFA